MSSVRSVDYAIGIVKINRLIPRPMSGRRRRPAGLTSVRRPNGSYGFPVSRFHRSVATRVHGRNRRAEANPLVAPVNGPSVSPAGLIPATSILRPRCLGLSHRELSASQSLLTHPRSLPISPLPTDFPGPFGRRSRGHPAFTGLEVLSGCPIARRAFIPTSPPGL